MKNILAENMRRFNTKNLTEDLDSNNNGYPDEFEGQVSNNASPIKQLWLKWIENLRIQKYSSAYDFKEAIKQKAIVLKTPEILDWVNRIDPTRYRDIYDFKEAINQKILSLD